MGAPALKRRSECAPRLQRGEVVEKLRALARAARSIPCRWVEEPPTPDLGPSGPCDPFDLRGEQMLFDIMHRPRAAWGHVLMAVPFPAVAYSELAGCTRALHLALFGAWRQRDLVLDLVDVAGLSNPAPVALAVGEVEAALRMMARIERSGAPATRFMAVTGPLFELAAALDSLRVAVEP